MPERPGPPAVGVVGLGRLGRGVLEACDRSGRPAVLTASRRTGWRIGQVPDVLIDASAPDAHEEVVRYCLRTGAALVECVSNLEPGQWDALAALAARVPVVRATNLSLGHYLQTRLVACLAAVRVDAARPPETSVHERHPATKAHRPSATAERLARLWTASGGGAVAEISSRRAGAPVSDHEVMWSWPAETLLLRHAVLGIEAAADGALAAAAWAAGRRAGLASMDEVYDDLARAGREAGR
jgi:4-hydroxy-tetrahydrodipicolinate reductase